MNIDYQTLTPYQQDMIQRTIDIGYEKACIERDAAKQANAAPILEAQLAEAVELLRTCQTRFGLLNGAITKDAWNALFDVTDGIRAFLGKVKP